MSCDHLPFSDWRDQQEYFWIGLNRKTEEWKWTGRVDDTFDSSLWYDSSSEDRVGCGYVVSGEDDIVDSDCDSHYYRYICEKTYN